MTTYAVAIVVAVVVALSQASSGDATRLAYKSYAAIAAELQSLQQQYPDYVEVFSAQERYGNLVPSAGSCGALHGGTTPCLQWFIHITNRKTMHERRPEVQAPTASVHPPTAADYCCSLLVQVFFSGNLHGDEQVGPQTLIAMARLLLQWVEEGSNPWITRLVDTRHIWMLPVSNAIGYDKVCSAPLCVCKQAKNVQRCQHVWAYPFCVDPACARREWHRPKQGLSLQQTGDALHGDCCRTCNQRALERACVSTCNHLPRRHAGRSPTLLCAAVPYMTLALPLRPGHRRLPMSGVHRTMSPIRPSRQTKWPRHSLPRS